jgi:hypothetical protein
MLISRAEEKVYRPNGDFREILFGKTTFLINVPSLF